MHRLVKVPIYPMYLCDLFFADAALCLSISFFFATFFFFPSPPSSSWGPLSPGVCQESPWPFPHLLSLESGSRNRQKTQVFACECKHSCIVPPKYHLHLDDYSLSCSLSLSLSLSLSFCALSLSLSLSLLSVAPSGNTHTLWGFLYIGWWCSESIELICNPFGNQWIIIFHVRVPRSVVSWRHRAGFRGVGKSNRGSF